jgi:beta-mannanase
MNASHGRGLLGAIAAPVMVGGIVFLLALQHGLLKKSPPVVAPWPIPPAPSATVDVGVTTAPLSRNAWRQWRPSDLETVNVFERDARKHASIIMWYSDWQHNASVPLAQLRAVDKRGSIPQITWEPWDASKGLRAAQPSYRLRNILAGNFDPYIRRWATTLAAWGKPVWLRFAQEMNGNWYPWAELANGNHRGEFVRAWRHIHDIFAAAGASNVRWVWSPVFGAPAAYFPGARYVDVLGLTCLNGGPGLAKKGWRSFAAICGRSIQQLHALAPRLPIEIAELASAERGGSKSAWIASMFASIARQPAVKAIVWFDIRKETDWRIESSAAATGAFAAGVSAARYK